MSNFNNSKKQIVTFTDWFSISSCFTLAQPLWKIVLRAPDLVDGRSRKLRCVRIVLRTEICIQFMHLMVTNMFPTIRKFVGILLEPISLSSFLSSGATKWDGPSDETAKIESQCLCLTSLSRSVPLYRKATTADERLRTLGLGFCNLWSGGLYHITDLVARSIVFAVLSKGRSHYVGSYTQCIITIYSQSNGSFHTFHSL